MESSDEYKIGAIFRMRQAGGNADYIFNRLGDFGYPISDSKKAQERFSVFTQSITEELRQFLREERIDVLRRLYLEISDEWSVLDRIRSYGAVLEYDELRAVLHEIPIIVDEKEGILQLHSDKDFQSCKQTQIELGWRINHIKELIENEIEEHENSNDKGFPSEQDNISNDAVAFRLNDVARIAAAFAIVSQRFDAELFAKAFGFEYDKKTFRASGQNRERDKNPRLVRVIKELAEHLSLEERTRLISELRK